MRYLIDGHNLIAQLPDIDLSDPDDELQLVYKLRSFCARTHHRVTVIFDGGIPGGTATRLSNKAVTARFASAEHLNADQILINELRRIKNVDAYTLVSSDNDIIETAREQGIKHLRTPAFIRLLVTAGVPKISTEKDDNPQVSPQEVDEWLRIFSNKKHPDK